MNTPDQIARLRDTFIVRLTNQEVAIVHTRRLVTPNSIRPVLHQMTMEELLRIHNGNISKVQSHLRSLWMRDDRVMSITFLNLLPYSPTPFPRKRQLMHHLTIEEIPCSEQYLVACQTCGHMSQEFLDITDADTHLHHHHEITQHPFDDLEIITHILTNYRLECSECGTLCIDDNPEVVDDMYDAHLNDAAFYVHLDDIASYEA